MSSPSTQVPARQPTTSKLSPLRLNLLRIAYLIMAVGLGAFMVPSLFEYSDQFVAEEGVRTSIFAGFAAMALLGLRYPLKMLPLLLLEFTWKAIYLLCYYLPLLSEGRVTDEIWVDAGACMMGAIFIPLFPWDYAFREYVLKAGDPWWRRRERSTGQQSPRLSHDTILDPAE